MNQYHLTATTRKGPDFSTGHSQSTTKTIVNKDTVLLIMCTIILVAKKKKKRRVFIKICHQFTIKNKLCRLLTSHHYLFLLHYSNNLLVNYINIQANIYIYIFYSMLKKSNPYCFFKTPLYNSSHLYSIHPPISLLTQQLNPKTVSMDPTLWTNTQDDTEYQ